MKVSVLLLLAACAVVSLGDETKAPTASDPPVTGTITEADMAEAARQPLPPRELKADPGRKDFDLKGDSKTLFEKVAEAFHLLVVFDSGYQPSKEFRLQLTGVDYKEALRALQDATNSFIIPIGDRLLLVANDSQQKRTELESNASVMIPIPEAISAQEVNELAQAVRGTLDLKKLTVDSARRLVLIRDAVWKVRAAQTIFHDLMQPRAQVAIELQILASSQSTSKHYGLQLPTASSLVSFGHGLKGWPVNMLSLPAGFARFMTFGGGATFMGLGITDATLFANATKSTSRSLFDTELVALDGQPSSLHVGDKYPLVTGQYFASTGTSGTNGYIPPPQFTFEDLGLILKITPHVHGTEEVTLEISAEYKLLGAGGFNGIPDIATRKFESKVRLVNGQWAILAGLLTVQDVKTITGIPGLTLIPFLHETTTSQDRGETLIILKPHLLVLPPTEAVTHTEWIGTETRGRSL